MWLFSLFSMRQRHNSVFSAWTSVFGLQAEILGAQVRHLRLEVDNFGLQSSQPFEKEFSSHQLLDHGNSLPRFPENG